jgi:hypothetical protein
MMNRRLFLQSMAGAALLAEPYQVRSRPTPASTESVKPIGVRASKTSS